MVKEKKKGFGKSNVGNLGEERTGEHKLAWKIVFGVKKEISMLEQELTWKNVMQPYNNKYRKVDINLNSY